MRILVIYIARFFLSAVFLVSGVTKLFSWNAAQQNLTNALQEAQSYQGVPPAMQDFVAMLIPWAPVVLIVGVLFELVGGFSILLGLRPRMGAALLIILLIPSTLLFYSFWFSEPGMMRDVQASMFFKNLSILGALMLVMVHGAEARSRDYS